MESHTGDRCVDVLDGEHDVAEPRVFAGAFGSPPSPPAMWNLVSSIRPFPSGVCIIAMSTDSVESDDAVHRVALDLCLTLRFESELGEELNRGCEVVNHDADVVHPLDGHGRDANHTPPFAGS